MTATAILSPIKPCKKCGAADRSNSGNCNVCNRAKASAWRAANLDRAKANSAAWNAANPERCKANDAAWNAANKQRIKAKGAAWYAANTERQKANRVAWRAANPERNKAGDAAWRAANPEALRIYNQNYQAKKRANGGVLSKGLSAKLFKLQRGLCPCCKQPLGKDFHLDHIFPIALGGEHVDENMQLLRSTCNHQKHAKHPVDFMQSRGFLL